MVVLLIPQKKLRKRKLLFAFTLIELLVVVAIIAVLISILLPAMGMAHEKMLATKCMSTLQQIGFAHVYYKQDNNGRGCIGFTYGAANARPNWSLPNPNPYSMWAGWYSAWYPYSMGYYLARRDSQVSGPESPLNSTVSCPKHGGGHGTGYAVNMYLGYDTYLGDHVLDDFLTPMLMCGNGYDYFTYYDYQTLSPSFDYMCFPQNGVFGSKRADGNFIKTGYEFLSKASWPHKGAANYLFFDGHVAHLTALGEPNFDDLAGMKALLRKYRRLWSWTGNPDRPDLYMWDPSR